MAIFTKEVTMGGWTDKRLTLPDLKLDEVLTAPGFYAEGNVRAADHNGYVRMVGSSEEYSRAITSLSHSAKIHGVESFSPAISEAIKRNVSRVMHKGPVTVTVVASPKGATPFPKVKDSLGTFLYVIAGQKLVTVDGVDYWLREGNTLLIAPGVGYVETNREMSFVLQIDFKPYLFDRLKKDKK